MFRMVTCFVLEAVVCLITEFRKFGIQLWAAAQSSAGEAECSLSSVFRAAFLPPGGEEGDLKSCWESCWESLERRRSTLWTRTESRTFFSSAENRPRTWRSTDVFPVGRPIPTRSLGITCGGDERRGDDAAVSHPNSRGLPSAYDSFAWFFFVVFFNFEKTKRYFFYLSFVSGVSTAKWLQQTRRHFL